MQIPPLLMRALVLRAFGIWIGIRAIVAAILLVARMDPIRLGPASVGEVVLLCIVVCTLDSLRRRERALFANLGIRPAVLVMIFAVPSAIGEGIIGALGRP